MASETIVYIGGFELPDRNAAAHRVLGNAKSLRSIGYNVVLIGIDKDLEFSEKTRVSIQNFDSWLTYYPKNFIQWSRYLFDIKDFLDIIKKYSNVKAVVCYNYQAAANFKILKYCRKNHIKIIADCSEWYSVKGNSIIFKIIKSIDTFTRMQIVNRNLDGIIVISRYLENIYKNCKNVVLIPPLVDKSEMKWSNIKKNGKVIEIVYVGSPGRNKDKIDIVVENLHKIRNKYNFVFKIIGITEIDYLSYYPNHRKIIFELNEKIQFEGHLTHIQSLSNLKNADYSIFFRNNSRLTNAGFPTKLVESLSCGTPVITNLTSNIQDYLINGNNSYILEDMNTKKIQNLFENILDENAKKIEVSDSNGLTMFDYTNFTEKIRKFINRVITP